MLNAPASRPAIPASRMKLGLPDEAPATPMTSERLLTSPSLTPKITARSVPDRPPVRCQASRLPISAALVARRAMATPSRPSPGHVAELVARLELVPDDRRARVRRRRWRPPRATRPGRRTASSSSPSRALTRSATARGAEEARRDDDEPDAHPRPVRRAARSAPSSRSLPAQISACRRSLPAIRRNASARRGILLDAGQRVVQDDRVAFQLEVVEALLDVDRGHGRIVGHRRRVDSRAMTTPDVRPCATCPPPTSWRPCRTSTRAWTSPNGHDRPRRRRRAAAQDRHPPAARRFGGPRHARVPARRGRRRVGTTGSA